MLLKKIRAQTVVGVALVRVSRMRRQRDADKMDLHSDHLWFETDGYVIGEIVDVDVVGIDVNMSQACLRKMIPLG